MKPKAKTTPKLPPESQNHFQPTTTTKAATQYGTELRVAAALYQKLHCDAGSAHVVEFVCVYTSKQWDGTSKKVDSTGGVQHIRVESMCVQVCAGVVCYLFQVCTPKGILAP